MTSPALPRRVKRASWQRDTAASALALLDQAALLELERIAGSSLTALEDGPGVDLADGFPTTLRMGPGLRGRAAKVCAEVDCHELAAPGRARCGEHSTEADEELDQLPPPPQSDPAGELAAILADGGARFDPLPEEVAKVFADLAEGADLIRSAAARMARIRRNPLARRQCSVGSCLCCEVTVVGLGEDRLRGGFCPACARAWERERAAWSGPGAPDRQDFIRRRRLYLQDRAS